MREITELIELRDLAKKLLKHELGHWLSAKELDFGVGDIDIKIGCTGPHSFQPSGHAMIFPLCEALEDLDEVETYITNRIIILISGVISEFYEHGRVRVEKANIALDTSANTDNIKIIELLNIARPIRFKGKYDSEAISEQLTTINSECWYKSEDIIESRAELIDYLSDELSKKVIMTNEKYIIKASEIQNLIQEREKTCA